MAGKSFCFFCGEPIKGAAGPTGALNRYARDFKQSGESSEEHVEFTFTDHAVSALAPAVVEQIMRPAMPRSVASVSMHANRRPTQPSLPFLAGEQLAEDAGDDVPVIEHRAPASSSEAAHRYFSVDGEFLTALEKDFRGKSWGAQQRNFFLVYTWAFRILMERPVPGREHLRAAADKNIVVDTKNISRYLQASLKEHFAEVGTGIILNNPGEKAVLQILADMGREDAEGGYAYWDRTVSTPRKRYVMSKEEKEKVAGWAEAKVDQGQLDFRGLSSAPQYILFGVWVITVHLEKAQAVRWQWVYEFLCRKYGAIAATSEAFSKAVSAPRMSRYLRGNGDEHFLTPEGRRLVENWISGASVDITYE